MSGGPAKGASKHGPGCGCARCAGFQSGHELSLRHGAYAGVVRLAPRASEIADDLRPLVPVYTDSDEPTVRLLALAFARLERAGAALDEVDARTSRDLVPYTIADAAKLQRLRQDALGWLNAARRLANDLGLTPTSRARLGLNVVRAHAEAEATLANLEAGGRKLRLAADEESST